MDDLKSVYSKVIDEHGGWLNSFGKEHLNKWEKLLRAHAEAAICEAATQKLLSDHKVQVEPNEAISVGGPDFLCIKNSKRFYVEETCISRETATRKTCLTDLPENTSGFQSFALLTRVIFGEMVNKTRQCSNLDAPCILVIGTLHFQTGLNYFHEDVIGDILTGTPCMTVQFDRKLKRAVGEVYEATDLQDSGVLRPDKTSTSLIEEARKTISTVLLYSFGEKPPRALGILHPKPNHKFERELLSGIKFCRLAEGYQQTGQLSVEWV